MQTRDVHHASRRFTLIELLVVIAIIAVLAGLVLPVLKHGRDRARQTTCLSNVHQVAMGIQMYYNDTTQYPDTDELSDSLKPYIGYGDFWFCPSTEEPYDLFYVARSTGEECDEHALARDNYFIGCLEHRIVNYAPGRGTMTVQMGSVKHNGKLISAGSEVEDGVLEFSDGSRVELNGRLLVVSSFQMPSGGVYTVLRVYTNYGHPTLDVTVPTEMENRSKLEIVTPAAIAGVVGTEFQIKYNRNPHKNKMKLKVHRGKVKVSGPYCSPHMVTPGSGEVDDEADRWDVQNIPSHRPLKNYTFADTIDPGVD